MSGLLLAGALVFGLGRALDPKAARRLWSAGGLAYLALAAATRTIPASGLEAALGASFLAAGYAIERLRRDAERPD